MHGNFKLSYRPFNKVDLNNDFILIQHDTHNTMAHTFDEVMTHYGHLMISYILCQ